MKTLSMTAVLMAVLVLVSGCTSCRKPGEVHDGIQASCKTFAFGCPADHVPCD